MENMELLLVVSLLFTGALANEFDTSACENANMEPVALDPNRATGRPPYNVTVNAGQYSAGGSVIVTLQGMEPFIGFMILALPESNASGSAIGSFQVANGWQEELVEPICVGRGATHTSELSQVPTFSLALKWSAPSILAGNIVFYVTFVRSEGEYWTKVASRPVWDGMSRLPTTRAPEKVTDPPAFSPAIRNDGCGTNKGCIEECEGQKCSFLVTWRKNGNKVDFEMFGTLFGSQGYIVLALSETPDMADASLIACTVDDARRSEVRQYYSEDGRAPYEYVEIGPINKESYDAGVQTNETANYKTMSCRFSYDNDVRDDKWKNLNDELYLIIARGEYSPPDLKEYDGNLKISPTPIQLFDTNYKSITTFKVNILIKAHACVMVIAWVLCGSIGIILGQYYKAMWTNTKTCGQKAWFAYHRALMLCAMIFTIIGFILILIFRNGKFVLPPQLPTKAHPIIGLIAIICSLLNPVLAAFRCNPDDDKRPFFNWFHWFFGAVAHIFAIVAIFLGMLMPSAVLPEWITYVLMAFCIFHLCVQVILEIHQCCMYDKNRDRQEEYLMINKPGEGKEPKYAGRGFKCGMLIFYVIVASLFTIALVVIIAIWGTAKIPLM